MRQVWTVASQLRLQRRFLARGVAAGLVALFIGLSFLLVRVVPTVTRTENSSRLVAQMYEGMLDEETGVRGYLLTDDQAFLQPYNAGVKSVAQAREQLAELGGNSKNLRSAVVANWSAVDAWQDGYAEPAIAAPADSAAQDARGKVLFDTFRTAEATLSAEVQHSVSDALTSERLCLFAGFGYALLMAVALLATVAVQGRRLDRWIGKPIADLDAAVGAMRDRAEIVEPPMDAPDELRRVWSNLAELNAELVTERDARKSRDAQLAARARRAAELLELTQDFAGSLDADDIRQHLEISAARLTAGGALLIDIDPVTRRPRPGVDASPGVFEAAKRRTPIFRNGRGTHILAVPLIIVDQDCLAVLQLDLDTDDIDPDVVTAVSTLCSHAATALTAARLHEQIAAASRLDSLTGLPNRRTFDADIAATVTRFAEGEVASLLMVDVDHFKQINDTYGHQAGDEVLRLVAVALGQAARPTDTVYRYGGEEFAVLLPGAHLIGAAACGRRLREHVADQLLVHNVTVSIGVADLHPHDTVHTLIARTDLALYQAKSAGRNRVATS
jgi:diguanylate cyclase (GGDEF)-like protein